jgi:hypothetical protein
VIASGSLPIKADPRVRRIVRRLKARRVLGTGKELESMSVASRRRRPHWDDKITRVLAVLIQLAELAELVRKMF